MKVNNYIIEAYADLRGADLREADLEGANLREANLIRANLGGADLRGANLIRANLIRANLEGADLRGADLRGANLREADLDFSCWPLWCGSLDAKVDTKIAMQLAYHFCSLTLDDPEYIAIRNNMLDFANKFHRIECPRLEKDDGEQKALDAMENGIALGENSFGDD